ncbi:MAG: FGGY family carbohydrate kinase, partial [Dehalococcoidia bacterium]
MPGRYLLALDAGTSGVRCLVADSHGTPLALVQRPVRYRTPAGGPSLAREFRPDAYFRQLARAVALALQRAGIVAEEVAAIGVTSQREGMVFLDSQGRELYAGPNIDLRAVFEGASLDAQWGEELYRVTGHLPSLMFAPARLLWFRHQRPQVYGRIATALTVAGWVAYRLTGERACEPSLGGEAGLLDIARRAYCTALLRRLEVSVEVLPPLVEAGTAVGPL